MNIHTGTLAYECSGMNIHTGKLIPNCPVARTRGQNGRIIRTGYGHEEFLQRQAEQQQDEGYVLAVHEEAQQAVVQQSWPG
ncbi:hypothetical protein A2U01_0051394, partial [Trifolium medium]|nr:hypothetical protein [Trifolium medium]